MTLSSYLHAAMTSARYKLLEDKSYFGEIPGFPGVWAGEKSLEQCRETLQEVLEDWIVLKLRTGTRSLPFGARSCTSQNRPVLRPLNRRQLIRRLREL